MPVIYSAALMGLQFVVMAPGANRRRITPTDEMGVRAVGTPTIIHFSVVFLLAALMTIPRQTILRLHVCVVGAAVFVLLYVVALGRAVDDALYGVALTAIVLRDQNPQRLGFGCVLRDRAAIA